MIRSALLVTIGIAITGFIALFTIIVSPFLARGENSIHEIARLWARIVLFLSGIENRVYGLENVLSKSPQIFMANHQSDFDIFICLAHIPGQFRWIAKKELYRIPIFGRAMKKAGYIPIDRFNRERALKSLDDAAAKVREGKSLMTFPEGTRSKDGRVKSFKKGLFYLAIQAGVPIVPVTIIGSHYIMKKRSLKVNPGKTAIVIDKPIDVTPYTLEERDQLISRVRDVIIKNFYSDAWLSKGKDDR